ncbi:MAG: cytochrome c oxidase subunit 4 [Actinobacteria bacterium]|nr:cytochrome c oxidase subunit 4 [Actinomycetota bacterium]
MTDDHDAGTVAAGGPSPGRADHVDSGRADESAGFVVQARLFGGLGLFLAGISVFYGVLSQEYAGTTFLALTSALALMIAAYQGSHRRRAASSHEPEPGHASEDEWSPAASIWPFAIAAAVTLVANGFLLGRWLLLPSLVFLAYALAGFAGQSRWRD